MLSNRRQDRKPRSSPLRWPSHLARRIRPRLHELEDRCLLSVTATADGFSTTVNTSLIAPAATVRVVQTGDGEVALPATAGSEFSGTSLPADWQIMSWPTTTGGSATVGNGVLTVDGSRAGTQALYGVGRSLEFTATFTGDPFQHVGFATDFSTGSPWAVFSTREGGNLYARTETGAGDNSEDTLLAGNWLNASHDFLINWTATGVTYSIDGNVVATSAKAFDAATTMRPLVGDFDVGGGAVQVASLHLIPPGYDVEFNSGTLPVDWSTTAGGQATVSGGLLTVDGTLAGPLALYGRGRSLELRAKFSGDPFQSAGFGTDFSAGSPWAMFSTGAGGHLYARTAGPNGVQDTLLDDALLNTLHDFRIDWTAAGVVYSVDGSQVATSANVFFDLTAMRPAVSDFGTGAGSVVVDWLRMSPYTSAGTFFSRVFDAGSSTAWGTATWQTTLPANTGVALSVRVGNSPTPDATWSDFQPLSGSGAAIPGTGRYAQYRADLTTNDPDQTPTLASVTLTTAGPSSFTDTTVADFAAGILGTGILANDHDDQGNPLTAVLVTGPAHGALTLAPDGSFVYTPATNFSGADNFTYQAQAPDGILSNPVTVTLAVNKITPVVTWGTPTSIVYGTALGAAQLNATSAVPGTFAYSPPLGTYLHAGPDQVLSATFTPTDTVTYDTVTASVLLSVTPATLTVKTVNASRVYGQANPAFSATITGFVNGDTAATVVAGAAAFSTTATAASGVGSYAITAAQGSLSLTAAPGTPGAGDYTFTLVDGTLAVTPAALTVTADNKTKVYGQANPALTATLTGFVNGDTAATAVTGAAALTTPATVASGVGSYAITAAKGTLSAANYTFATFTGGTLAVTPAALTVKANNATKVYGQANPAFSATISGFVNGDTAAVVSGAAAFSTTATAASGVGSYAITPSQGSLSAANYSFAFAGGTLTVTPATLTVKANDATRAYNQANPTFTAAISGFVNGDTAAVVSGSASLTTTATTTSPVGSYAITAAKGTLSAANYTFAFANGTLTVTPAVAPLTGPKAGVQGTWGNNFTGVRGQSLSFSAAFSGSPSNPTAVIDWGDGTTSPAVIGSGKASASHAYAASGTYAVKVTVSDTNGLAGVATGSVTILAMELQADPVNPAKIALAVGGTLANDIIGFAPGSQTGQVIAGVASPTATGAEAFVGTFSPTATGCQLAITLNGTTVQVVASSQPAVNLSRVLAFGQAGNDLVAAAATFPLPAWLSGGADNDMVIGGAGDDQLDGGDGNDVLVGNAGKDVLTHGGGRGVLIGGAGADQLNAGGGEDILIGGSTVYDNDLQSLAAIAAEWGRTDADFKTRINHLTVKGTGLNGDAVLIAGKVTDDAAADSLTAGTGRDWLLARKTGSGTLDKLLDLNTDPNLGDVVTNI